MVRVQAPAFARPLECCGDSRAGVSGQSSLPGRQGCQHAASCLLSAHAYAPGAGAVVRSRSMGA